MTFKKKLGYTKKPALRVFKGHESPENSSKPHNFITASGSPYDRQFFQGDRCTL